MANRRRNQSHFDPKTIFGLVMAVAGLACLAVGFGLLNPFTA